MKIIFINVPGLGGKAKLLALRDLVEVENPNILMLQENTVVGVDMVYRLEKLFPQFCFFSVHSSGCLGGLISGFSSHLHVLNVFGGVSNLGVEVRSLELEQSFWF